MRKRRTSAGVRRLYFFFILMLILGTVCVVLIDGKVRPMLKTYGSNQTITAATRAVNEAVNEVLNDASIRYEDLATVSKDSDGSISAVSLNTASMNKIKSAVSEAILKKLEEQTFQKVSIPIGSLFGGLLTGRGPSIRIKVPVNSTVETDYKSVFDSAGINQTRHQITISVKVVVYAVIQGEDTANEVSSAFTLAESILVGEVPGWVVGSSGK